MEPLQAGFSHFFPSHVMDRAQNAYVGGMGNIFHPELGSSVFSAHSHPQTLPSTLPGTRGAQESVWSTHPELTPL